jgi:uncharacterized protein (DUF302 family)
METGLVTASSSYDYDSLVHRADKAIAERGLTLFAHIDHAALAADAGLHLRPTIVLMFGNPKGGTPVMEAAPTLAIDLPLKLLIWQDDEGTAHVTYTTMTFLAHRHGLAETDPRVGTFDALLASLANEITS